MPMRSEWRIGAALRDSVLVVLEAAVPTYACCGCWGGPSDGRAEKEERERTRGDLIELVPRTSPLLRRPRDVGEAYGGWFEGGPEIVREITERLDGRGASLVGIDHPSR